MSCQPTRNHGGTTSAYYKVKGANLKGFIALWQKKMMEIGRDKESVVARLSGERGTITRTRKLRTVKALCALQWDVCALCSSHSKQTVQWQQAPLSTTHADGGAVRWKGSWELLGPYSDFAVNGKLLKNKDVWKTSIDHIPGVAIL